jgi:hypothetical protein
MFTMFEDGMHDAALAQATVILQYFIGKLAKNLVEMFPHELS